MDLRDAIRSIAGTDKISVFGILATVISVDPGSATCDCDPIDDSATIEGVRLQSGPGNGKLYIPKVGSVVIVHLVSDSEGYVTMFSELDSIQFLDGSHGGLTKTQELKTQLDKSNEVLSAIANVLTTWSPVPNDGGAALKAAVIAALAGKTIGNFSNIENTDITHGAP